MTDVSVGFSFPKVDAVDVLPPDRRPLLIALRQHAEDLSNLVSPLRDQVAELRAEKHRLEVRLRDLKLPRGAGGPGLNDDDIQVVDARQKLDCVIAEMARLSELIEGRSARAANAARLLQRCEDWLRGGRPSGTAVVAAEEIEARDLMKHGETITTAIERCRHRLRELDADRRRVESAPLPSKDARRLVREAVQALARRGEPDVSPVIAAGLSIAWPQTMLELGLAAVGQGNSRVVGYAQGEAVDGLALMCWIFGDQILAKLEAQIDEMAADTNALSQVDRAEQLAQIGDDRLAVERVEVALIRQTAAGGMAVDFRADCDPRAVLGVELLASTAELLRPPFGMAAQAVHTIDVG